MQSGDDGLAQLAEKLHGIRENLPGADGETPNVPASDIRIKRNSGNVNFGTQVNIGAPSYRSRLPSQRRSLNNRVEEIAGSTASILASSGAKSFIRDSASVTSVSYRRRSMSRLFKR